jgi:predicted kinase
MTTLYLIRGLPGAGKSTLGETLRTAGAVAVSIAADDWMVNDAGEYDFQPTQLTRCHELCQREAESRLRQGQSVAVCNTFSRRWEMAGYYTIAYCLDADVVEITVRGPWQGVHNVPQRAIKAMAERWEA